MTMSIVIPGTVNLVFLQSVERPGDHHLLGQVNVVIVPLHDLDGSHGPLSPYGEHLRAARIRYSRSIQPTFRHRLN